MFHEFGHALHGMLTKCNYKGVSGTSVAQDFAELPSSICAVQSCLEDFAIFKLALSKKSYAIFLFLSGVASEYAA